MSLEEQLHISRLCSRYSESLFKSLLLTPDLSTRRAGMPVSMGTEPLLNLLLFKGRRGCWSFQ